MKIRAIQAAILTLLVSASLYSQSIHTMLMTRKAMKEPPSLEVILSRIGDIYAAQDFTQKILFETPISPDSKWANDLGTLSDKNAAEMIATLRKSGAYSNEYRAILPLTLYVDYGRPILQNAGTDGKYKNLIEAVGVLTGKDLSPINAEYQAVREKEKTFLDMAGQLALLQTAYQLSKEPEDRQKLLDQRVALKATKKELKGMRKALINHLNSILDEAAKQPGEASLQQAVYSALSYAYVLNQSAIDAAVAVGIQSVRVIPDIPAEIKELGPRLLKDGISGVMDAVKGTADLSAINPEDLAMAVLSQMSFTGGKASIDNGKLAEVVNSNDKLAALKGLAPDVLSQVLDKIQGSALTPFTDLINNAMQAPERITKSIDLVQFNLGVLSALERRDVTGKKDLGDDLYVIPMPKIKEMEKKAAKQDSAMQAQSNAMAEKINKMSPRNLEMSFAHISLGFSGLPGSSIYGDRYNGLYGYGDEAAYPDKSDYSADGKGVCINMLSVTTEKSDFLRDAMFYNVSWIQATGAGKSPDSMAEVSGGDLGITFAFTKDPFFFLPHVIGSGPAAVEWYAGGGVSMDFGFGFRSLTRTSKKWADVYGVDSSRMRGDVTEMRYIWNNGLTGAGVVRLFDGMLSVSGMYTQYFKQASLLNLSMMLTDSKYEEKDSTVNTPWKLKDYKYEWDTDHAAQNLFGAANYIASGFYEGGHSMNFCARLDLPFQVQAISNFLINSGEKAAKAQNKPYPTWQRCVKGTLGISVNFNQSAHEYSIKKGRDKLGVTNPLTPGSLTNANSEDPQSFSEEDLFYYDVKNKSIGVLIDVGINTDYIAIGAR